MKGNECLAQWPIEQKKKKNNCNEKQMYLPLNSLWTMDLYIAM